MKFLKHIIIIITTLIAFKYLEVFSVPAIIGAIIIILELKDIIKECLDFLSYDNEISYIENNISCNNEKFQYTWSYSSKSDSEILKEIVKKCKLNKNIKDLTFIKENAKFESKKPKVIELFDNTLISDAKKDIIKNTNTNEIFDKIINALKNATYSTSAICNILSSINKITIETQNVKIIINEQKLENCFVSAKFIKQLIKDSLKDYNVIIESNNEETIYDYFINKKINGNK